MIPVGSDRKVCPVRDWITLRMICEIPVKPPVKRPLKSYMEDIGEIEQMTGIDFFPKLSGEMELLTL